MSKKRKRKINYSMMILSIIVISVVVIAGGWAIKTVLDYNAININFIADLNLEINSEIDPNTLVKNTSGSIEYPNVDTSKLGELELTFIVTNDNGATREFKKVFHVVDTTAPDLKLANTKVFIDNNAVDLLGNVELASDNSNENIAVEVSGDIGEVGQIYPITYTLSDSSGNTTVKTAYYLYNVTPDTLKKPLFIKDILFVDKDIPLPKDYDPGRDVDADLAFSSLLNDMNDLGYTVKESSVYRNYEAQQKLYDKSLEIYGNNIGLYVGTPGYSEHQTGLAFDITDGSGDFANSKAYTWLKENCAEYGFILRYPHDKTDITGYSYEAWHWRYVGVTTAREIMSNNLTLDEYLGLVNGN
ncbi:MAG: D-alanyl-D-alanine carboxypeptidase family protein [Erysipelotrichaceae bacterium]